MTTEAAPPRSDFVVRSTARLKRNAEAVNVVVELIRPQLARLPLVAFLAAGIATDAELKQLFGGVLVILASCGLAATMNDIRDVDIDRRNNRMRPLATGRANVKMAWLVAACCFAAILISQAFLQQPAGAFVSAGVAIAGWLYSSKRIQLQARGLVAHVLLAGCYVASPIALAVAGLPASPDRLPAVLACVMFITTGALLTKDLKDEAGDREFGKRTPLVRWGFKRMRTVAVVLVVFGIVVGVGGLGMGVGGLGMGVWLIPTTALALMLAVLQSNPSTKALFTLRTALVVAVALLALNLA